MGITLKRQTSTYDPKDHKISEGGKDFSYAMGNGLEKGKAEAKNKIAEVQKSDLNYKYYLENRDIGTLTFKGMSMNVIRETGSHIVNPLQLGIDCLIIFGIFFIFKRNYFRKRKVN